MCLCQRWIQWKGTAGLFSRGWTDRWWAVAASSSVVSHTYTADTRAFIICPQALPCHSPLQLLTSLTPAPSSNGEKSICKAQPEGTFPSKAFPDRPIRSFSTHAFRFFCNGCFLFLLLTRWHFKITIFQEAADLCRFLFHYKTITKVGKSPKEVLQPDQGWHFQPGQLCRGSAFFSPPSMWGHCDMSASPSL